MPTELRLWDVSGSAPVPLPQERLDQEGRLEKWIADNVGLVDENLLVIGQQVNTDYGGRIDLLAMDADGNLAILELKRDKTPRDIIAQALDYASWVEKLDATRIEEIANSFLRDGSTLQDAFQAKFAQPLPDTLNTEHKMYIVASGLDDASERIVAYLSQTHGIGINVALFSYFKTPQGEYLGRTMLLDQGQVEQRRQARSKRRYATVEELGEVARERGVYPIYERAVAYFRANFSTYPSKNTVGFYRDNKALVSLVPIESEAAKGLVIAFHFDRLPALGITHDAVRSIVGDRIEKTRAAMTDAYFVNANQLEPLLALFESSNASTG